MLGNCHFLVEERCLMQRDKLPIDPFFPQHSSHHMALWKKRTAEDDPKKRLLRQ